MDAWINVERNPGKQTGSELLAGTNGQRILERSAVGTQLFIYQCEGLISEAS